MKRRFASRLLKVLLSIIALLVVANVIGIVVRGSSSDIWTLRFIHYFGLNNEFNIPSLYSSLTLLTAALLLFTIAITSKRSRPFRWHWLGLGAVFSFLAIDEFFSIHEQLAAPVRNTFALDGVLYYAWVVPYAALGGFLVLMYIRFLRQLPSKTLGLFLLSGGIYVAGAIGFEMIGSFIHSEVGNQNNIWYTVMYTIEESLEMLGVALFIYALIQYLPKRVLKNYVERYPAINYAFAK